MISKLDTGAAIAISRLATQFKESFQFTGIAGALGTASQNLDDQIVLASQVIRDPAVATGATLDKIGELVGAPNRAGMSDADYRTRIAAQIEVNTTTGIGNDVISIATALVPAWTAPNLIEQWGSAPFISVGAVEIRGNTDTVAYAITDAQAAELARFLAEGAPAGVRVIVVYRPPSILVNQAFRFSGGSPPETAVGFNVGKFYGAKDK